MGARRVENMIVGKICSSVAFTAHVFATLLVATVAAHAFSMDKTSSMKDYCQAFLGADAIQMWGYQPEAPSHQYCDAIPATGPVILTFDLLTPGLRDMKIDVRIVRAPLKPITDEMDLTPLTIAYREAKLFPGGVITVDHNFEESGLYYAIVTATEPTTGERKTARFSFSVGWTLYAYLPIILGAIFLAGLVAAYWRHAASLGRGRS